MYREFLNPCYFKEAEHINQMVEDIYRCESAKEKISSMIDTGHYQLDDVYNALHMYHLDLQMQINDYMDSHFVDRETYCCNKKK